MRIRVFGRFALACLVVATVWAPVAVPASADAGSSAVFKIAALPAPTAPEPWRPADWDVIVHSRDLNTWQSPQPIEAEHGPDCAPPPATHLVQTYEDSVYVCKNHLMTAINAEGYAAIYLTPSHLVDFSHGEAVIGYDVSTARESQRDWHDIWVSGFDDNLVLPLYFLPDLQGPPRNAVHVQLSGDNTFKGTLFENFVARDLDHRDGTPYDRVLAPSATARTHFELRLTRTHIRFGMPALGLWWIDQDIPSLPFDMGVVQFGHHSYNPTKAANGKPGTWHWSGFQIAPSVPFSLLRGDVAAVNQTTRGYVCFGAPASTDAHLRFAGVGTLNVSFDGGRTFQAAVPAAQVGPHGEGKPQVGLFASYWMPVPAGTTGVVFQGTDWWGGPWWVRDPSIWALTGPAPVAAREGSCSGQMAPRATTGAGAAANQTATTAVAVDRDAFIWKFLGRQSHESFFFIAAGGVGSILVFGMFLGSLATRTRRRRRS